MGKEKPMANRIKERKMNINKDYIDYLIFEALKSKKEENTEATGASSAGAFTGPAFSMFAKDDVARSEYKKPKVKVVRENNICEECGETEKECTCPKKVEAKEATGSSSVGAYDTPGFQDVNMKGNTLKGKGRSWKKPQVPGGDFVSVKDRCKTFPYCNQGDIDSLHIGKKPKQNRMYESIQNISKKTGLSESKIKNIILSALNDNL